MSQRSIETFVGNLRGYIEKWLSAISDHEDPEIIGEQIRQIDIWTNEATLYSRKVKTYEIRRKIGELTNDIYLEVLGVAEQYRHFNTKNVLMAEKYLDDVKVEIFKLVNQLHYAANMSLGR